VGEVADKTGQINFENDSTALTQGVAEMVMSALAQTGMVRLMERFDMRVPLAEISLSERELTGRVKSDFQLEPFDFLILGALTELNYNIVSQGVGLHISGIGGGVRSVVINVALDLRVVDARTFEVRYVTNLQKQVRGVEVEANVFRFFGDTLVEFDAGRIRNEPLQLGVRSVVEMAVYQIMTEFLGLPGSQECSLVRPTYE
jgi:curli production assembly/transport component CsgG/holdfast attachment protein HfaB